MGKTQKIVRSSILHLRNHLQSHVKTSNPIVFVITFYSFYKNEKVTAAINHLQSFCSVVHLPFSTLSLSDIEIHNAENFFSSFDVSPDVIIAIGGGAVLDLSKILKDRFMKIKTAGQKPIFHIAVPTTAGSGSEATPFAAYYVNGIKQSFEHSDALPDFVLLDSILPVMSPLYSRISSALDAFAQAVESLWSVNSTELSQSLAVQAIKRIHPSIRPFILTSDPKAAREMQEGSFLAGKAIATARTTLAHALSYSLTSQYKIPHGIAVMLCLPAVIKHNDLILQEDCLDIRGAEHVKMQMRSLTRILLHDADVIKDYGLELAHYFYDLLRSFCISPDLRDHGVRSKQEVQLMIDSALQSSRSRNNPRLTDPHFLAENLWNASSNFKYSTKTGKNIYAVSHRARATT